MKSKLWLLFPLLLLVGHSRADEVEEDWRRGYAVQVEYFQGLALFGSDIACQAEDHPMIPDRRPMSRTEAAGEWIQWETDRWSETLLLVASGSQWDWSDAYTVHRDHLRRVDQLRHQAAGHYERNSGKR